MYHQQYSQIIPKYFILCTLSIIAPSEQREREGDAEKRDRSPREETTTMPEAGIIFGADKRARFAHKSRAMCSPPAPPAPLQHPASETFAERETIRPTEPLSRRSFCLDWSRARDDVFKGATRESRSHFRLDHLLSRAAPAARVMYSVSREKADSPKRDTKNCFTTRTLRPDTGMLTGRGDRYR